jgi:hypothetical protein
MIKTAALLVLLALPALAEGPSIFSDGRKLVIDRTARPRALLFYDKNFALVKTATLEAKETGIASVDAAGNVASLSYIDLKDERRLVIYDSKGRLIADLPMKTLLAEAKVEDGKILAGEEKSGITVLARDGTVLERRAPTMPDISEKKLFKLRKKR